MSSTVTLTHYHTPPLLAIFPLDNLPTVLNCHEFALGYGVSNQAKDKRVAVRLVRIAQGLENCKNRRNPMEKKNIGTSISPSNPKVNGKLKLQQLLRKPTH
jgi:hypothetical protein